MERSASISQESFHTAPSDDPDAFLAELGPPTAGCPDCDARTPWLEEVLVGRFDHRAGHLLHARMAPDANVCGNVTSRIPDAGCRRILREIGFQELCTEPIGGVGDWPEGVVVQPSVFRLSRPTGFSERGEDSPSRAIPWLCGNLDAVNGISIHIAKRGVKCKRGREDAAVLVITSHSWFDFTKFFVQVILMVLKSEFKVDNEPLELIAIKAARVSIAALFDCLDKINLRNSLRTATTIGISICGKTLSYRIPSGASPSGIGWKVLDVHGPRTGSAPHFSAWGGMFAAALDDIIPNIIPALLAIWSRILSGERDLYLVRGRCVARVSMVVLFLASITTPVPFLGDIRPILPITGTDFEDIQTRLKSKMALPHTVIVGSVNPLVVDPLDSYAAVIIDISKEGNPKFRNRMPPASFLQTKKTLDYGFLGIEINLPLTAMSVGQVFYAATLRSICEPLNFIMRELRAEIETHIWRNPSYEDKPRVRLNSQADWRNILTLDAVKIVQKRQEKLDELRNWVSFVPKRGWYELDDKLLLRKFVAAHGAGGGLRQMFEEHNDVLAGVRIKSFVHRQISRDLKVSDIDEEEREYIKGLMSNLRQTLDDDVVRFVSKM